MSLCGRPLPCCRYSCHMPVQLMTPAIMGHHLRSGMPKMCWPPVMYLSSPLTPWHHMYWHAKFA